MIDTAFQPGTIVAEKYRLERLIGEGGMGFVAAATHLLLNRPVALKFLQREAKKKPALVARFNQEARALARLTSEHVARVIDVAQEEDGSPFIVMEYLEGEDLEQILAREGRISVERTVDYILQACEAMAEAHAARIIHRDLKPANLFLARLWDGRQVVKVLDFGISKTLDDEGSITKTSTGLGSAHYMAPEQMRNAKSCDARADIWALGVMLYELVSGVRPFEGDSVHEIIVSVLEQKTTPVLQRVPDLPKAIVDAIERCLTVKLDRRLASVEQLVEVLAPLAPDEGTLERVRRLAPSAPESLARRPAAPTPSSGIKVSTATPAFGRKEGSGPILAAPSVTGRHDAVLDDDALSALSEPLELATDIGRGQRPSPSTPHAALPFKPPSTGHMLAHSSSALRAPPSLLVKNVVHCTSCKALMPPGV